MSNLVSDAAPGDEEQYRGDELQQRQPGSGPRPRPLDGTVDYVFNCPGDILQSFSASGRLEHFWGRGRGA